MPSHGGVFDLPAASGSLDVGRLAQRPLRSVASRRDWGRFGRPRIPLSFLAVGNPESQTEPESYSSIAPGDSESVLEQTRLDRRDGLEVFGTELARVVQVLILSTPARSLVR